VALESLAPYCTSKRQKNNHTSIQVKSSHFLLLLFIYLFTILVVSKQRYSEKKKLMKQIVLAVQESHCPV